MATNWTYLPILKWKQGERIALRELNSTQWQSITPLIELPPVDAAPDGRSLRAALPSFLSAIASDLKKTIPEGKPVAIDVRFVSPGYAQQATLLSTVCSYLLKHSDRSIIPVITEAMAVQNQAELPRLADFPECMLRMHTPAISSTQVAPLVTIVVGSGIKRSRLHLVVDQHSIVREDPTVRYAVVHPYLDASIATGCASTTLAGGSFPMNLVGFKQGVADIPHVEWRIYELARKHADYDDVRYADYAVTNPAPAPAVDPREMNPSVAIRYAADGYWRLFKAGGFKKGKPDQYRNLCNLLLGDSTYAGAGFSYGDTCYEKAANGKLGNGNPSSWRRDATNHHLVLMASRL